MVGHRTLLAISANEAGRLFHDADDYSNHAYLLLVEAYDHIHEDSWAYDYHIHEDSGAYNFIYMLINIKGHINLYIPYMPSLLSLNRGN